MSCRSCSTCTHWSIVNFGPDYFGICGAAKERVGEEPQPTTYMVVGEAPGMTGRLWTRCDFSCIAWEEKS
jgi:uracil-DNA glycosylase